MNNLLDNEEDESPHQRDREITLGTSTVLGIFFGLAILCAAFFGFGYSLGSKHISPAVASADTTGTRSFSAFKPAPGSPINSASTTYTPPPSAPPAGPPPPPSGPAAPPAASEAEQPSVKTPKTLAPASPTPVAAATTAVPVTPGTLAIVVQVAALSHQEDADLIRSTLERRGYTVSVHPDPQDKLLHVQVGPFANRKDAEAMRQKLLGDGFNAYIK